jgi:hypothetical protein
LCFHVNANLHYGLDLAGTTRAADAAVANAHSMRLADMSAAKYEVRVMSDMDELLNALHAISTNPQDEPLEYVSDWGGDRLDRAAPALQKAGKIGIFRFMDPGRSSVSTGAAIRVWMPKQGASSTAPIDDSDLVKLASYSGYLAPARSVARSFKPYSFYIALLLKAVRDRSVYDWESLTRFQKYHSLRFFKWGSSMVGEAPAVV